MTLRWDEFPGAPAEGTTLCAEKEVPQTGVLSVVVGGYPALLLWADGNIRAFVNACPHQFLPLDHKSGDIVGTSGQHLICSNHDAVFDAVSGEGIAGFGVGCTLSPIPVTRADGQIAISAQNM